MPDLVLPDSGRPAPPPFPVSLSDGDRRVRDVLPAVVRQVPIGVAVVRRDRSVAYHNDEFARILAIQPGRQGTGVVLAPMARPDGSPFEHQDPLDDVLGRGAATSRRPVLVRGQDGSTTDACVTMTPIVDAGGGPVVGAVIYAEDQTAELEDVSLREAFVSVLSHELRTPITSIYGGTQLLLADRLSAEVRASVIHDIAAEAEQLHRLVEDLMAIARIERGLIRAATDPILLQRLAVNAARAEERRWPGRRVEVHAPFDLPAVRADDLYVTQVLRNLIANSVKYAPPDEPVQVVLRPHDDVVSVVVLDRGPGFPPDTGPDAFRLFYRSPGVAAHVPGTGIGLYVARALVEAQGGRIWLRDRVGGGAEVGFELPLYAIDDE
ncbi:MAG: sensor histidine kinase [Candidatus Limnocylindria bacterium]